MGGKKKKWLEMHNCGTKTVRARKGAKGPGKKALKIRCGKRLPSSFGKGKTPHGLKGEGGLTDVGRNGQMNLSTGKAKSFANLYAVK